MLNPITAKRRHKIRSSTSACKSHRILSIGIRFHGRFYLKRRAITSNHLILTDDPTNRPVVTITTMATGFTPQQIQSLENFINQKLNAIFDQLQNRSLLALSPALPSTPPPAPLELPPLPLADPPTPPPDNDTLKEVEYKQAYRSLRTIRQQPITQKPRASKALPKSRDTEFFVFRNYIAWPPKFGGINMHLSRDEHLDA